jgi:fatty acid desaturase
MATYSVVSCNFSATEAFNLEFEELQRQWRAAGVFEGSISVVLGEVVLMGLLLFASAFLSHRRPLLGGSCVGLCQLVCLRLAHSCGHEAGVFKPELAHSEALYFGRDLFVSNVGIGIDFGWWKWQHKQHHRYTMSRADPQMPRGGNMLPICAWEEAPLSSFLDEHPWTGLPVRFQEVWWLPALLVAGKPFISQLSYQGIPNASPNPGGMLIRKVALWAHYVILALFAWCWVWRAEDIQKNGVVQSRRRWHTLQWLFACLVVSASVHPMFLFNHIQTGPSPTTEADHKLAQVCHTVNYNLPLPLVEHFVPTSHHIEHHIAPKIPHENLHLVAQDVETLVRRHGLPYAEENFAHAVWKHTVTLAGLHRDRFSGSLALVAPLAAFGAVRLIERMRLRSALSAMIDIELSENGKDV